MASEAVEAEKQAQFERDRAAFEALPRPQQHMAAAIAYGSIFTRGVIVRTGEAVLVLSEICFNVLFRWPFTLAARLVSAISEKTVAGVKLGVTGLTGAARGAVSLAKDGLALVGRGAEYLHKKGLMPQETRDRVVRKVAASQASLSSKRDGIAVWGGKAKEKIDHAWSAAKEKLREGLKKTAEFLEYYGAIGLYRGTKWILDPRLPSGRPLFGNERVNKTVGLVAAAGIFVALSLEFSKLLVVGKIWHYKLAHAFFTSKAPLKIRLLKQTLLQPAIATGLASLKFVTLPIIAATRKTMKTTPFTQAIAYRYNKRLRAKDKKDHSKVFTKNASPPAEPPKTRLGWVAAFVHQKSFGCLRSFVHHVIEKASPEFYEVRYRYYQEKHAAAKEAGEKTRAPMFPDRPETAAPALGQAPQLGPAFDSASSTPASDAPPDIALSKNPTPKPPNALSP